MLRAYRDHYYQSSDGLRLYARDYDGADTDAPVVLCMHGLTRNSVDFEALIEILPLHYRVLSVDQRGRGNSEYDPNPDNYQVNVYVNDMLHLLDELEVKQAALIGTSMGGIMAIVMQARWPRRFSGIVLNDIGPELDPVGMQRITSSVSDAPPVENWKQAIESLKQDLQYAFPKYLEADWQELTQRLYREDERGVPVLNYDPLISRPMSAQNDDSSSVLWSMFDAICELPLLLVRGELSDLLSMQCVQEMQSRHASMQFVEVPDVGHVPILNERLAAEAIIEFLNSVCGD
ncbi:MAG: alpha/beta fold hydrolase [Pseudomonadales bacterium]